VTLDITNTDYRGEKMDGYTFTFDEVFEPSSTQEDVYNKTARPIVQDVLEGYYATVRYWG